MKKGYRNAAERTQDILDRAAKVWQSAYTRALGWESDPEGYAHKAMTDFLRGRA